MHTTARVLNPYWPGVRSTPASSLIVLADRDLDARWIGMQASHAERLWPAGPVGLRPGCDRHRSPGRWRATRELVVSREALPRRVRMMAGHRPSVCQTRSALRSPAHGRKSAESPGPVLSIVLDLPPGDGEPERAVYRRNT